MFGHIQTWDYPTVHDYTSAWLAWDRAPRARDETKRWIKAGQRDKWIARRGESIAFVWGGRDMVVWHPSVGDAESVTLAPWSSTRSFTEFTNAFLPGSLQVEWHRVGAPYVTTNSGWSFSYRHYRVTQATRFERQEGSWRPVGKLEPFRYPQLDKAAGRAALEASPYGDFVDWATAFIALGGWRRSGHPDALPATNAMFFMEPNTTTGREQIMLALRAPERWWELLSSRALTRYANDAETAFGRASEIIRLCVYADAGTFKVEEHDYLEGANAIRTWHDACRRYRAAL